jgi:hypothetical protein
LLGGVLVTCDDDVLGRLRDDYPGWDIGRLTMFNGGPGLWLATRDRVLSTGEMCDGLLHTLAADTAEQLRSALAAQRRLEMSASREPV